MGVLGREAALDDILGMVPPEVSLQIKGLMSEAENKESEKKAKARPMLRRSSTSTLTVDSTLVTPDGDGKELSQISWQRRCVQLEAQVNTWMSVAQLLASELAYREKKLWDWQTEQTNTRAVLQRFKDRLKKVDTPGGSSSASPTGGGTEGNETRRNEGQINIPTSAAGISMLIVEPDPADARQLKTHCTDAGYKCTVVPTGEKALEQVRKAATGAYQPQGSAFELVLCDVELPDMPGVEVLLQTREILKDNVTIIMMSNANND